MVQQTFRYKLHQSEVKQMKRMTALLLAGLPAVYLAISYLSLWERWHGVGHDGEGL